MRDVLPVPGGPYRRRPSLCGKPGTENLPVFLVKWSSRYKSYAGRRAYRGRGPQRRRRASLSLGLLRACGLSGKKREENVFSSESAYRL
eukprot:scaffold72682_cov30-Tisochrysis_lutea.AAC.4